MHNSTLHAAMVEVTGAQHQGNGSTNSSPSPSPSPTDTTTPAARVVAVERHQRHSQSPEESGPEPGSDDELAERKLPFVCEQCGCGFTRVYDLRRHQRQHSGERPFTCHFCGRAFARADALVRHQRRGSSGGGGGGASAEASGPDWSASGEMRCSRKRRRSKLAIPYSTGDVGHPPATGMSTSGVRKFVSYPSDPRAKRAMSTPTTATTRVTEEKRAMSSHTDEKSVPKQKGGITLDRITTDGLDAGERHRPTPLRLVPSASPQTGGWTPQMFGAPMVSSPGEFLGPPISNTPVDQAAFQQLSTHCQLLEARIQRLEQRLDRVEARSHEPASKD